MAPPTAYMLFCSENRGNVRQKLTAEGHDKIAVTLVAKELGQLWKTLSDEEKAAYKAKADELLQQHRQQQQQQAEDGAAEQDGQGGEQQQPDGPAENKPASLPIGVMRKVIGVDPDIKRCSAEALQALSAVADVFIAAMCSKATAAAAGAKRRTVRLDDIERCVRTDKRLVAVGMTAVTAMVNAAAAPAATEDGKAGPPGKKPRLDKAPAAKNNISIERAFGLAQ